MANEDEVLVCMVPDHVGQGADCRWETSDIPWAIADVVKGLTEDEMRAATRSVYAHIASECGIQPREVETAAKARILLTAGEIDGEGGTLAWAQLCCGNIRQSVQKYDSGERDWTIHPDGPWPSGMMDWWRVCLHETLHSLGLPHGGNDIMKPSVDPRISRIGDWTRAELRRRYGPPKLKPPDVPSPPTPPTAGGGIMDFVFKLIQFLKDNPWIISFIKKLLDVSAAKGGITVADLESEVASLKQQQDAA